MAAAVECAVGEFAAFRLSDARFHIGIAEAARSRRLIAAETQIQVEIAEIRASSPDRDWIVGLRLGLGR